MHFNGRLLDLVMSCFLQIAATNLKWICMIKRLCIKCYLFHERGWRETSGSQIFTNKNVWGVVCWFFYFVFFKNLYCFWNNWEQKVKREYIKNTLKMLSEIECWDCTGEKWTQNANITTFDLSGYRISLSLEKKKNN